MLEPPGAGQRLLLENTVQLPAPELHRGALLGIVAVPVVHARDVPLLGVIQNPTDQEARNAAASHQTRRSATEIMAPNVCSIPRFSAYLPSRDDIRARALSESATHVFVVAHAGF